MPPWLDRSGTRDSASSDPADCRPQRGSADVLASPIAVRNAAGADRRPARDRDRARGVRPRPRLPTEREPRLDAGVSRPRCAKPFGGWRRSVRRHAAWPQRRRFRAAAAGTCAAEMIRRTLLPAGTASRRLFDFRQLIEPHDRPGRRPERRTTEDASASARRSRLPGGRDRPRGVPRRRRVAAHAAIALATQNPYLADLERRRSASRSASGSAPSHTAHRSARTRAIEHLRRSPTPSSRAKPTRRPTSLAGALRVTETCCGSCESTIGSETAEAPA